MIFHLDDDIFRVVKKGIKNVEVRVNDQKRQNLKIGDTIAFYKRPSDDEMIEVVVTNLKYYNNFEELGNYYPMERLYLRDFNKDAWYDLMKRFYSTEEVIKYGVVAIEFKLK